MPTIGDSDAPSEYTEAMNTKISGCVLYGLVACVHSTVVETEEKAHRHASSGLTQTVRLEDDHSHREYPGFVTKRFRAATVVATSSGESPSASMSMRRYQPAYLTILNSVPPPRILTENPEPE